LACTPAPDKQRCPDKTQRKACPHRRRARAARGVGLGSIGGHSARAQGPPPPSRRWVCPSTHTHTHTTHTHTHTSARTAQTHNAEHRKHTHPLGWRSGEAYALRFAAWIPRPCPRPAPARPHSPAFCPFRHASSTAACAERLPDRVSRCPRRRAWVRAALDGHARKNARCRLFGLVA